MKKTALLLLTALLLSSLLGCAGLPPLPSLNDAKDYFDNLYMQDEQESDQGNQEEEPPYVEDTTSYGYYYDQLSESSKVVYRSIYLDNKNREDIPIVFREPLSFSFPHEKADIAEDIVRGAIGSIVQPALDALVYDHPNISWIAMEKGKGSTFRISSRKQTDANGDVTICIKMMTFQMVYEDGLTEDGIVQDELAMKAAAMFAGMPITEKSSRYEKLVILQEYLCRSVIYESEALRAHDAAGALLDGRAVCDGYAKAFKLLCDAYDIPCLIVPGTATQNGKSEPHAWNYVQMENGEWYAVDVTWDDHEDITKQYFLVGSGTVTTMTEGHFSNSHRAAGKFSAGNYTPFTFPELSFFRYTEPLLPGDWQKGTEL